MLKNLKQIINFKILAKDSRHKFGKIKDIYIDDDKWTVRYLVVDTGKWLSEHLILISPYAVSDVDWNEETVWVDLTMEQIEFGPKSDLNNPTSRLYEVQYDNTYGLPNYWTSGLGVEVDGIWPGQYYPLRPESLRVYNKTEQELEKDHRLCSMNDVLSYHIQAVGDDDFGSISDFILEEGTWAVRYIVIDTHKFWPGGKKILFSPLWVQEFDFRSKKLVTDFHRKVIESCPEYNPLTPIELIEDGLFSQFGTSGNWNLKGWISKGMNYSSHHPKSKGD